MKHPPVPKDAIKLKLSVRYTPHELEVLRIPFRDMEQWFLYFEDPWLRIYKGERCYFWLRIPETSHPAMIEDAYVDSEYPRARSDNTGKHVEDRLDDWCDLINLREEAVLVGEASVWIKRNKIALDSSGHHVGGLLSPSQARLLGETLISLAKSLSEAEKSVNPKKNAAN